MASLTGNQINNTYQGLLKTENNGAIGATAINLTDGVGNQTGLSLNASLNEFKFMKPNAEFSVANSNFDITTYPMSATSGDNTYLNFKDQNGQYPAYISQDRYGSLYFNNVNGDQGEAHVFRSKTNTGTTTPAKIAMDAYNSVNNSNNWYLGYQQSVDSLSYNSGTGDLTLGRQDATDLVVNIPGGGVTSLNTLTGGLTLAAGTGISVTDNGTDTITITSTGGGGSAGLVSGTAPDSMRSADALTTTASVSIFPNDIILGNGAKSTYTTATNDYTTSGGIAIGENAEIRKTNDYSFAPSQNAIAIGKNALAYLSTSPTEGAIAIGSNARAQNTRSVSIGCNPVASGDSAIVIGHRSISGTSSYSITMGDSVTNSGYSGIMMGSGGASLTGGGFGQTSINMGYASVVSSQSSISLGNSNTVASLESAVIGRSNGIATSVNGSFIIGNNNNINNNSGAGGFGNFILGDYCSTNGGNYNTILGGNSVNLPAGQNDNVSIGRTNGIGAGTSNSIMIGLVSQIYANSGDSVTIGRSSQIGSATSAASNSVAIGRDAKVLGGGNSTSVGAFSQTTAPNATAVGYQAVAANSGWTATPQLEITNYATLNFADDAAAATGGVPLGGIYHNAGALRIRIV